MKFLLRIFVTMLSRKTKYGIKALTFLAQQEKNDPTQISMIASSENISQKFLESILLTLRKAGILGSKKGKGGGYYLLKDANDIKIAQVYRVLEGPIAMVPCVSLNFYEKCDDCPDEDACSVHSLMIQVRDSTLNILENTSLADIIAKE
jgi:Rrf2 family protein